MGCACNKKGATKIAPLSKIRNLPSPEEVKPTRIRIKINKPFFHAMKGSISLNGEFDYKYT